MGNCLKINSADDISLLRGSEFNNTQDFSTDQNGPAPIYSELLQPVFFPSPSVRRPASHLTEEEQVKIAKRIGLIQHLPIGTYDGSTKTRECVICMVDFCVEESVRYLPCMHIYHVHCIDDWLMRSLTCPSCMEPVDAALLTSYETT
ncbi:RING finger protein 11 [Anastrepha ludens]|uniref:RING finger protein 11 n=1 Tax=Anastrepha ludens TaxID=28586 RepID=UPI0023B12F0C|nr:RING finger protein 11 [Anastrepha ludens]